MLELNRLYNLDCMQGMKEFPDGFFDLAIVDHLTGLGLTDSGSAFAEIRSTTGKSIRGKAGTMNRRQKNISESLNGYPEIKSFGAGITLFRC